MCWIEKMIAIVLVVSTSIITKQKLGRSNYARLLQVRKYVFSFCFYPRDVRRKRGLCSRKMVVSLSVRLSVTRRYCVLSAKHILKL